MTELRAKIEKLCDEYGIAADQPGGVDFFVDDIMELVK